MYFSFSIQKIIFLSIILLLLFITVAGTFMYKDAKFGNVLLPTALGRLFEKDLFYVLFAARFGSDSLKANPLASLGATASYDANDHARAVPVLLYHGLIENSNEAVEPTTFAEQMHTLHEAGWQTITLEDLNDFMRGKKDLPKHSFLLTFDDGARDSYYPVDPVLTLLGYNAVSFIIAEHSIGGGTHYYLSSGEIKDMLSSGHWEIGSHTYNSHDMLPINQAGDVGPALSNLLWLTDKGRTETLSEFETRAKDDLTHAQNALEETFGVPVRTLAYPFGEYGQLNVSNPKVVDTVEQIAGSLYDMAFYQTWKGEGYSYNYPEPDATGMLSIRRIEPLPSTSADKLLKSMESGLPKDLPYTDSFDSDNGWISVWSDYSIASSSLRLASNNGETGAGVVLDGTRDWRDYHIHATLESPPQTGVYFWVRFKDNNNNAACNFGNGYVHAEEIVNGERNVIRGTREGTITIPKGVFTVDVEVHGRTLTCTLNGQASVTTNFIDESLDSGGVGIKVWDPEPGKAELLVHDLSIDAL